MTKKPTQHEPMREPKGSRHPSGQPRRMQKHGVSTRIRVPFDGRLSPGLQPRGLTHAVGFHVPFIGGDESVFDD